MAEPTKKPSYVPSELKWDANDQDRSCSDLYAHLIDHAGRAASWYRTKKRSKQIMSITIRLLALLSILIGGLCPLFPSGTQAETVRPFGYLLLGLGGGLLLYDKLFGFSSSWIRYMRAIQEIEASIDRFQIEWARLRASTDKTPKHRAAIFKLSMDFVNSTNIIVRRETNEWQVEFQDNLLKLKAMANQAEQDRKRK